MDEHNLRKWEASLRRGYTSNVGVIKEYVVCVPIDHSANSNNPPLQNGMIVECTSYDRTDQFPIHHEYILYEAPREAKFALEICRDLNRDGSPIFRGYVFGEMEKYMKLPAEKLSQLLVDEVATNQLNSVNSSVILSTTPSLQY